MKDYILKRVVNRFLMRNFCLNKIQTDERVVYLTFDDGPEEGITEFVLDMLAEYDFKATFFCKGACAEQNPQLVDRIRQSGHRLGNHTYSHIPAYVQDGKSYVEDVYRADNVLKSAYFRPPNGCLTLYSWWKLRKRFRVIYWSVASGDWVKEEALDVDKCMVALRRTKPGDIVLFHFCKELEYGTRQLLPLYLQWLRDNHFISEAL